MMAFQAEMNRDPKQRARPYTPADFMPPPEKIQQPEKELRGLGPEVFAEFERAFGDG